MTTYSRSLGILTTVALSMTALCSAPAQAQRRLPPAPASFAQVTPYECFTDDADLVFAGWVALNAGNHHNSFELDLQVQYLGKDVNSNAGGWITQANGKVFNSLSYDFISGPCDQFSGPYVTMNLQSPV